MPYSHAHSGPASRLPHAWEVRCGLENGGILSAPQAGDRLQLSVKLRANRTCEENNGVLADGMCVSFRGEGGRGEIDCDVIWQLTNNSEAAQDGCQMARDRVGKKGM